jgi:hypothetical protein
MAGRVLRNSKGQYAGSTRGWGRGRAAHGGGFGGGRKGKTKKLRSAAQTAALVKAGQAIGVASATAVLGAGMVYQGSRRGNLGMAAAALPVNIAASVATASAARHILASRSIPKRGRKR